MEAASDSANCMPALGLRCLRCPALRCQANREGASRTEPTHAWSTRAIDAFACKRLDGVILAVAGTMLTW